MTRDRELVLAAMISHEIKNPLESVICSLEVSLRQPDCPDLVRLALEQARHINDVVRSMLYIAKSNAIEPNVAVEEFVIADVLVFACNAYSVSAELTGVTLNVDPAQKEFPLCSGDVLHIKQVLSNLVSNALKFTPPGGSITLRVDESSSGHFCFCVRDTGMGMSVERKRLLFGLFEQAPETASLGTGLGLALCRQLVTLMHGSIWAESELGNGSTFKFEIPLATVVAKAKSDSRVVPLANPACRKRSVLIVDDEPGIRSLWSAIFSSFGGDCTAVATSCEGLHVFQKRHFDLVIVDNSMGDGNGLDFISRLRKLTASSPGKVHVVLASGDLSAELAEAVLSAGADYVLEKPVGNSGLKDLWEKCFSSAEHSGTAAA